MCSLQNNRNTQKVFVYPSEKKKKILTLKSCNQSANRLIVIALKLANIS